MCPKCIYTSWLSGFWLHYTLVELGEYRVNKQVYGDQYGSDGWKHQSGIQTSCRVFGFNVIPPFIWYCPFPIEWKMVIVGLKSWEGRTQVGRAHRLCSQEQSCTFLHYLNVCQKHVKGSKKNIFFFSNHLSPPQRSEEENQYGVTFTHLSN